MSENDALLRTLRAQREHILGMLDGLDDAALRRPALPSGWSCLGLVQHLTVDVERFWFRAVVVGDGDVIRGYDDYTDAWQVGADASAEAVLARYREESAAADTVIRTTPADTAPAWWPRETHGEQFLHTLRDVALHAITETACHAGHLDAARELMDGRRWLVLT